ncbi:hypothetical protein D3C87_1326310 [compost metagenome]
MNHFINEHDFGVDVFLEQVIKNNKASDKSYYKRDQHKIPALLKIEIDQAYGQAYCKGSN